MDVRTLAKFTAIFLYVEHIYQNCSSAIVSFRSQLVRWGKTAPRRFKKRAEDLNKIQPHERLRVPLKQEIVGHLRLYSVDGVILYDHPSLEKVLAITKIDIEHARHYWLVRRNAELATHFTTIQVPMPYYFATRDLKAVELARHVHNSSFVLIAHYLQNSLRKTGSFPHSSQILWLQPKSAQTWITMGAATQI